MIGRLFVCRSDSTDPYYNLALEQCLLESVQECCILYLWRNENTVVIGKNQNPWTECKTALLQQEGGKLARRLSGGGAVYHDLGNLNFTFLMPKPDFDVDRQLRVIEEAVRSLGIPAERSGRNDILAEGRKFSGNAFYKNGRQAYHHGTLLVDADLEKLGRYLSPPAGKLKSKGVGSVRSRVGNLKQLRRDLTIRELEEALIASFSEIYGLSPEPVTFPDTEKLTALTRRNESWEWNYGQRLPFTAEYEGHFPWGGIRAELKLEHGIIRSVRVYTDAMDWELAPRAEQALLACRFAPDVLAERLSGVEHGEDILKIFTL